MPHLWPTGSSAGSPPRLRPGTSPQTLQIPPRGGHPVLRLSSGQNADLGTPLGCFRCFQLRARVGDSLSSFPGQRRVTAAFGYDAPHPSARGTLTLLIWALPSTHYAPSDFLAAFSTPSPFRLSVDTPILGGAVRISHVYPTPLIACRALRPRRSPGPLPNDENRDGAFESMQTLGLLRFNRLTGLNRFSPKAYGLQPPCLRLTHAVTDTSPRLGIECAGSALF